MTESGRDAERLTKSFVVWKIVAQSNMRAESFREMTTSDIVAFFLGNFEARHSCGSGPKKRRWRSWLFVESSGSVGGRGAGKRLHMRARIQTRELRIDFQTPHVTLLRPP